MSIDLGNSTNKGIVTLKLAHQFQNDEILRDEYVSWFFNESTIRSIQENFMDIDSEPKDDDAKLLRIAYWYAILREKYGDEVIENAIASGCRQTLLLGAGYDTRFFRLPCLQDSSIKTFEIDLPNTINKKDKILCQKLGLIPSGLCLIPFDLNKDDFNSISQYGFD